MKSSRLSSVFILIILAALSLAACSRLTGGVSSTPTNPELTKPKPVVESVNAATSGMKDKYYAILDINLKNEGADGTVIVVATVTQGGYTAENDLPVYIGQGAKQTVKLVLPLKWEGGDWKPDVQVKVP